MYLILLLQLIVLLGDNKLGGINLHIVDYSYCVHDYPCI